MNPTSNCNSSGRKVPFFPKSINNFCHRRKSACFSHVAPYKPLLCNLCIMELHSSHYSTNFAPSSRKKVGNKTQKKKKQSTDRKDDDDDTIEERNEKNLRYINVLKDLARLRDHYYSIYLAKLEAKVEQQRKELKAKEEKYKKFLVEAEARKVKKAHLVARKLPKVILTDDKEYLLHVPKSRYYHLVAVEELMKSRGLLKRSSEVEEFWKKAKQDQKFWVQPIPTRVSPDRLTEHLISRYSSLTSNSKTAQSDNTATKLDPLPGIFKKSMDSSNEEQVTDERSDSPPLQFPKQPKFPKLHSFKKNLVAPPYPEIVRYLEKAKKEVPKANPRHKVRTLQHHLAKNAYDVAVVNAAMTGRLLKRHDVKVESLKPISEISEIWCSQSETASTSSKSTKNSNPRRKVQAKKTSKELKMSELLRDQSPLNAVQEEKANDSYIHQPLSMDMMVSGGNLSVKDAKCQSLYWVNYAGNGSDEMTN